LKIENHQPKSKLKRRKATEVARLSDVGELAKKNFAIESVGVVELMKMFVNMPKSGKLYFEARECSWKMS
jgi:hypothetical protein